MRVFVTGGTGAIGGHVVPLLVAQGHAVSALAKRQYADATAAAFSRDAPSPYRQDGNGSAK